ncbi:hypothetical protein MLD38_024401 [Melastoma candidum]|uniref:Uncharacterized protein n=1 Tax=Melastoma candidum TaxID=119954 RepID=A0ACB9NSJ3_9MYRT|nr:hypothetical protein MLD38_024401 [Melastoma candidum]
MVNFTRQSLKLVLPHQAPVATDPPNNGNSSKLPTFRHHTPQTPLFPLSLASGSRSNPRLQCLPNPKVVARTSSSPKLGVESHFNSRPTRFQCSTCQPHPNDSRKVAPKDVGSLSESNSPRLAPIATSILAPGRKQVLYPNTENSKSGSGNLHLFLRYEPHPDNGNFALQVPRQQLSNPGDSWLGAFLEMGKRDEKILIYQKNRT